MASRDWCRKEERQRGHVWAARWSLTLPDGSRRFGRVTEPTKRECDDAVFAAMDAARHGGKPKPDALTVQQWLDDWLADHGRTIRPQTAERYARSIRQHVMPQLGPLRLQRLSERDLRAWIAALERDGASPVTIERARIVLGVALNRAVAVGLLDRSPLKQAKGPRVEPAPVVAYGADEAAALYAAAETDDAIFVLAIDRGLRRGELLGLKWDDVDLARGRIHIQRQRTIVGGALVEGPPKTKRSRRIVVVPDRSRDALKRWRVKQVEDRLRAGPLWSDTGYVFTDGLGQPWSVERLDAAWRRLVARAGVRYLPPHALRHTFATLALAAGVHPKLVQETLGHASIAMTLDRYSHVSEEMQWDAAAKVEALLETAKTSESCHSAPIATEMD